MLQICPQNVVTSTQFHRYTQQRRHYIDIANCAHQSSHFFCLLAGGGLRQVRDGADSSSCSFNIYLSLSTSLAMPWWRASLSGRGWTLLPVRPSTQLQHDVSLAKEWYGPPKYAFWGEQWPKGSLHGKS